MKNDAPTIRAVIFDMDGLMLDTEPYYRSAWQQASTECGFPLTDAMYSRLIDQKRASAEQILRSEFGLGFPLETFRAACQEYEKSVFSGGPPPKKPGLDELLMLLDCRGIPRAVGTSTEGERARFQLAAAQLLDRFDVLVTGDEVAKGKPWSDTFLLAAQRLGVDHPACLVLEDAEPGVIAARWAGMLVYLVPDLNSASLTARQLAHETFDTLSAVARHLELECGFNRIR